MVDRHMFVDEDAAADPRQLRFQLRQLWRRENVVVVAKNDIRTERRLQLHQPLDVGDCFRNVFMAIEQISGNRDQIDRLP